MTTMQSLLQGWRAYAWLLAICMVLFIPGQASLPVMDRDEARFMQATRQMVESGDYVVVRFQEQLRAKKPVGIYWLQAAAVKLFSAPADTQAWPYRLPSLLAAMLAVLLTFRFASLWFDRTAAGCAALSLASCLLLNVEAHLAKTDATLLAMTTLTMGCLGWVYTQQQNKQSMPYWAVWGFWLGLGAGILIKGPVTPMIVLLTLGTLWTADRRIAWFGQLRPLWGSVLVLIMVLPWVWAVSGQTQGEFLSRAVREDLLPKLLSAQESHGAPPGFYVLVVGLMLWPASLWLWPALQFAWRQRTTPALRFLLAWVIPSWLVFELIPTKLVHYTLPLYPALAMLLAALLSASSATPFKRTAYGWAIWCSVLALILVAVALYVPVAYGAGFAPSAWLVVGLLLATLWLAWRYIQGREQRWQPHYALIMLLGGLVHVSLLWHVVSTAPQLWVSQRAVATARAIAPQGVLTSVGFQEPSLVFLAGTATQLNNAATAAQALLTDKVSVALVEQRQWANFIAALPNAEQVRQCGEVDGFNYSVGKSVQLHLIVRADTPCKAQLTVK